MVNQTTVTSFNAKEEIRYDDQYMITYGYQQTKVLLAALGAYNKDKTSKLFVSGLADAEKLYATLSKGSIGERMHPSGPCLPGVMRPFVSTDGSIYPCERVSEDSQIMKIGHIDTGLDLSKVDDMLNIGRITEDECKACWAFLHCGLCVNTCDGDSSLSRDERLKYCPDCKARTLDNMKTVCLLLENSYDFEREAAIRKGAGYYA
jgi:uncharacterized protein